MRSANRLFRPAQPSTTANSTTAHGLPAFVRPIEEQLLQALLCNTVQDTFYSDKKGMLDETKRVHEAALKHDLVFYASALAYARKRGLMRTQAVYGLANLAAHSALDPATARPHGAGPSSLFEQIFNDVILTPNDLADFHSMVRALKGGTDGGRRVKRVAGKWLTTRLGEYWAIKYGAEKKGAFALRDLFRIYHPRRKMAANIPLIAWLQGAKDANVEALPQVSAFEALKRAKTSEEKVAAILAGRLPHEVATTFAGKDKEVWKAIVTQMPAFALLRNLATIERAGVMNDVRELIVAKFTDAKLANARIFPFNFLKAIDHVRDAAVKDSLRVGLETCLGGAETVPGKTLVALDISGSMQGIIRQAAIFAIATARRAPGSAMILFNESGYDFPVSRVDSVLTQAQGVPCAGGTDHGVIVRWLEQKKEKFDNVIVVTDEQQQQGTPFVDEVSRWRGSKLGKGTKFFVANLAGYTAHGGLLKPGVDNFSVFGLNESSIQFLVRAAQGWGTFVDEVKSGVTAAAEDNSAALEEATAE